MIRVGIVGASAIAEEHLAAYGAFPQLCEVVALADVAVANAEAAVRRHDLRARCFPSHTDLLASGKVDLVSVCTPPATHCAIAVDALRGGCHVLVEKPMALSLEDCDAMLEAERSSGTVLSVVAQNRFRTGIVRLKSVVDSGLIGRVRHAAVDSCWWRGPSYYDLWWRGTWESEGGGCTLSHAVHHLDLMLWLMGMPSELTAMMANLAHDNAEVEDLSAAVFRFPNGAHAQLTSSVVHHGQRQQVVLQGERALLADPFACYASVARANGFPERDTSLEGELVSAYEAVPVLEHEGHSGQIRDVLVAIAERRQPLVDGTAARRAIEVAMALYASAISGRPTALPLSPGHPFYSKAGLLEHAPRFHRKTRSVPGFGDNRITTGGNY